MHYPELYAPYETAVKYRDAMDRALDFLKITDRRPQAAASGDYIPRHNTWLISVHFNNDPYWLGYLVEVSGTDAKFFNGPIFTNELTPEQKADSL